MMQDLLISFLVIAKIEISTLSWIEYAYILPIWSLHKLGQPQVSHDDPLNVAMKTDNKTELIKRTSERITFEIIKQNKPWIMLAMASWVND